MSELNCTTIGNQAGTKTVPSETVVAGSAKAWVNFNGTGTVAIRDSFNVASITDNGAGDYTVNITTALSSADYAVSGIAGGTDYRRYLSLNTTAKTASLIYVAVSNESGAKLDESDISVIANAN